MSRIFLTLASLALIATSCDEMFNTSPSATQSVAESKPVVTLLPVIDHTQNDYSWSLTDEISSLLHYRLSVGERFYIADMAEAKRRTQATLHTHNPFGNDLSWVKKTFPGHEFLIFLELIDHREVLRGDRQKRMDAKACSADLTMAMRVRVLDVRGTGTKVVLQEIVHNSHFLPRHLTKENYKQVSWKEEDYNLSPLGIAHADFAKEIASRIEDYILLNAI